MHSKHSSVHSAKHSHSGSHGHHKPAGSVHRSTSPLDSTGIPGYSLKPNYSAKKMSKPVHFYCQAPGAEHVSIMGDFNQWDPAANPMQRMPDGTWRAELAMHHGHHQYVFVVDGKPVLDPRAQGVSRNAKGERVSLLAVS